MAKTIVTIRKNSKPSTAQIEKKRIEIARILSIARDWAEHRRHALMDEMCELDKQDRQLTKERREIAQFAEEMSIVEELLNTDVYTYGPKKISRRIYSHLTPVELEKMEAEDDALLAAFEHD